MSIANTEHATTLWFANDVPVRLFFAGRRWRVTDIPTRLRETIWSRPLGEGPGLYGWRFQATNSHGMSRVFDVFRTEDGWHVHHVYE